MIPSLRVIDGPTSSGVNSSVASSLNFGRLGAPPAVRLGSPRPCGNRISQRVALGCDRLHQHCFSWWLRLDGYRLGSEIEGYAKYIRVLDVEQSLRVFTSYDCRRSARPTHLLTKKLRAERADTQHVRDRPSVPTLGQHRNGHDASNRSAERVRLADGVHHLTQQVFIGELLGLPAVAGSFDNLAPEALDLIARRSPKVLVECLLRSRAASLSMSSARGRANGLPWSSSKLRKSSSRPFTSEEEPSSLLRWNPEM